MFEKFVRCASLLGAWTSINTRQDDGKILPHESGIAVKRLAKQWILAETGMVGFGDGPGFRPCPGTRQFLIAKQFVGSALVNSK